MRQFLKKNFLKKNKKDIKKMKQIFNQSTQIGKMILTRLKIILTINNDYTKNS